MPFTPFHLGPALGAGLPLRKHLHVPTFMVASVILDIEPLLVLVFRLNYPLHGYLHTFLLALLVGFLVGYTAYKLERFVQPVFRMLQLETGEGLTLRYFLLAGASGAALHVLLDAPLYADIRPFFPLLTNPLYNSSMSTALGISMLCIWMGIFGLAFYAALILFTAYKKSSARKR